MMACATSEYLLEKEMMRIHQYEVSRKANKDALRFELSRQNGNVAKIRESVLNLRRTLGQLQSSVIKEEPEWKARENKFHTLQTSLEKEEPKLAELKKQVNELRDAIKADAVSIESFKKERSEALERDEKREQEVLAEKESQEVVLKSAEESYAEAKDDTEKKVRLEKDKILALGDEVSSEKRRATALEERFKSQEELLLEKEKTYEDLKDELCHKELEVKSLSLGVSKREHEKSQLLEQLEEAKKNLAGAEEAHKKSLNDIAELKRQKQQIGEERVLLEAEVEKLQKEEKEKKARNEQISELEKEYEETLERQRKEQENIENTKQKLQLVADERAKLESQCAELEKACNQQLGISLETANQECKEIDEAVRDAQATISARMEAATKLESLRQQQARVVSDMTKLKDKLQSLTTKNDQKKKSDLEADIVDMTKKLTMLKEDRSEPLEDENALKEKILETQEEIESLGKEVATCDEKLRDLSERQANRCTEIIKVHEEMIRPLKLKAASLLPEIEQLEKDIADAEKKRDALLQEEEEVVGGKEHEEPQPQMPTTDPSTRTKTVQSTPANFKSQLIEAPSPFSPVFGSTGRFSLQGPTASSTPIQGSNKFFKNKTPKSMATPGAVSKQTLPPLQRTKTWWSSQGKTPKSSMKTYMKTVKSPIPAKKTSNAKEKPIPMSLFDETPE